MYAAPDSNLVLATAGGSPDWLLGPLRHLGLGFSDGPLAGPSFYAGLWLALILYALILLGASNISPKLAITSIIGLQIVFFLAPPLLSQDVFSYIAYARLDVVHSLNPYTHAPNDAPADAVFGFAGSKDATSAYGPLFTVLTLPLAKLSVADAYWTLKLVALLSSLGVVALTWRAAQLLGRDPVFAAMFVGLNPIVLVHVVAGAHNDAFMMVLVMGGVLTLLNSAFALSGALGALGAAVKASAVMPLAFMFAGARRRASFAAGAIAAAGLTLTASLIAFGGQAIDSLLLIGQNQERTTKWSIPQKLADGLAALSGGDADAIVSGTRAVLGLALLCVAVALFLRAWHGRGDPRVWIEAAGWATLALLCASAWLVPWYVIWLMPLVAIAGNKRLAVASVALCAYMLVIAVPL